MDGKLWQKHFKFRRLQFRLTVMRHDYSRGDHRYVVQTSTSWDTKPKNVESFKSKIVMADPELERLLAEEEEIERILQQKGLGEMPDRPSFGGWL